MCRLQYSCSGNRLFQWKYIWNYLLILFHKYLVFSGRRCCCCFMLRTSPALRPWSTGVLFALHELLLANVRDFGEDFTPTDLRSSVLPCDQHGTTSAFSLWLELLLVGLKFCCSLSCFVCRAAVRPGQHRCRTSPVLDVDARSAPRDGSDFRRLTLLLSSLLLSVAV